MGTDIVRDGSEVQRRTLVPHRRAALSPLPDGAQLNGHKKRADWISSPSPSSKNCVAPPDGDEILDTLVETFRRYVSLPDGAAEALSLWVVFTHALDAAQASPRLALLSPAPRCGKTTVLAILGHLVRTRLLASNVTPAALFRVIASKKPTLLIDEADTFLDGVNEFKSVFNSGHTRATAFVLRCDGDSHEPKEFSTWAAIAIAKIGKLYPALADRSIVIHMRRRRPSEEVERLRPSDTSSLGELKNKISKWAKLHLKVLRNADPELPLGLNDRAADNWRPLLAIADQAGGRWPEIARQTATTLSGDVEDPAFGVMLLADIKKVFEVEETDRLSSADLCKKLSKQENRPWADINEGFAIKPRILAKLLEPFGIKPNVVRIGEGTPRGYKLRDFEDAFERYVPTEDATPQQSKEISGLGHKGPATRPP